MAVLAACAHDALVGHEIAFIDSGGLIEAHFYRVIDIAEGVAVPASTRLRAGKGRGCHLPMFTRSGNPLLAHCPGKGVKSQEVGRNSPDSAML